VQPLQRLQRLHAAGGDAGSSSSSSSSAATGCETAGLGNALINRTLSFCFELDLLCEDSQTAAAVGQQGAPSSPGDAGAAAEAASAGKVLAVVRQQAGTLFAVLEGFFRAQSCPMAPGIQHMVSKLAGMCCLNHPWQPALMLALAQDGSSEQQAAFLSLLLSQMKLSGTDASDKQQADISRLAAAGAASMLPVLAAAGDGRDSWLFVCLLVLGRSCLHTSAVLRSLQQVERHGLVRVMQQPLQPHAPSAAVLL
jgi:hypothetical protein